jgi:predicted transcriptional regulator
MKLSEVAHVLDATFLSGEEQADTEIRGVCASDLMSDVLAFGSPGVLLLTGLTNAQSIMTADVADVAAVTYVRGKRPENGTVELARQKGIPVLLCNLPMFEACGRMFREGLAPGVRAEQ